jgi:hypothetical protein
METTITHHQGQVPVSVIHLEGDVRSGNNLEQTAQDLYDSGTRYILLDFSDVGFMSSAGLAAIHTMYMLLQSEDSKAEANRVKEGVRTGAYKSPHLKLLKPNKNVLQVLKLAGYDMFIEIHNDMDKALASFEAAG